MHFLQKIKYLHRLLSLFMISGLLICYSCNNKQQAPQAAKDLTLWYRQPAKEWTDALPIGNGRLGAMIFGGIQQDHIQFNEETLWTGEPRDYNRKDAVKYLPQIRKLLFEGKQKEAEALAEKHFMGKKSHEDDYDSLFNNWLLKVRRPAALQMAKADYDDSQWPEMPVPTPQGFERVVDSMEGENGAFWFRTSFDLPKSWAHKKLILGLGNVRDMDFSYVNGHLIGSEKSLGKIREYTVPAALLHAGKNVIAIQVINPDNKGGLAGYLSSRYKSKMAIYPEGSNWQDGIDLEKKWKFTVQDDNPPPAPHYEASYQPFGDLWLRFTKLDSGAIKDYKRSLDIANAISYTSYESKGVHYQRSYFASAPAKAIIIHLSADKNGMINFSASLSSKHRLSNIKKIDSHTLAMDIRLKKGILKAESRLKIIAEKGNLNIDSNKIIIKNADAATLILTAATSFKNYNDVSGNPAALCEQALKASEDKDYQRLKEDHIKSYQHYFNTFSIDLGHSPKEKLPTDERLQQFDSDSDPALMALYIQYARYLMISTSWPETLPLNLQGIWNNHMRPPWGSKYTTNINLEMNYWPVEVLNLSACHEPLFAMMETLSKTGHETAKDYYGCPGWVLHHNTDIWGGTAPIDAANHGIWVTGGAWLCHQLWEHYLFTQDTTFLRDTAYPIMRKAADFFNCFLIKDPKTGWLISSPSNSPEHGGLVAGPTMDHEIIRDLFKNCISASKILNVDGQFRDTLQQKYKEIAPDQIGRYGQLQEWLQDIDDTSDHHRHVSHLWVVYPGTDITWKTPALMKAARQSLIYRGDEGTGWSLAWKVNLWDRFKDGDHAFHLAKMMLSPADAPGREGRGGSYNNLFDAHPPFQIDGNFGGAAGFAGMLIQSQTGKIELLPALPKELPQGEVKGICARGAFVLDIKWAKGQLENVRVLSRAGKKCTLLYGDKQVSFDTQKGTWYQFDKNLKSL